MGNDLPESIEVMEPMPESNLDDEEVISVELTNEEKAKKFFDGCKRWEPEADKRSFITKLFKKSTSKYETKLCVFTADGEDPVCKYLPFDPQTQLLTNPETEEVFLKPLRGEIYFFHKYKCLPLVDCPPVDVTYDLPEHLAQKFYNLGFGEAELSGYKALIQKINKWQLQVTLCMVVTLLVVLGCAFMFKTNADQVAAMQLTVDVLSKMYGT